MPDDMPAIIRYGDGLIDEYPVDEYDASLRRAFGVHRADFVVLDSNPRGQRFLVACVAWAIREGLLRVDAVADDGQSEVCKIRLTEHGRARYA